MTRHKIIVDPIAGRGAGERAAAQIEALSGGYGLDFDIERSRRPWHATDLAREAVADGCGCVAGGDSGWSSSCCRPRLRRFQPSAVAGLCPWKGGKMTFTYRVVIWTIKGVLRLLCRVDDAQLAKVPDQGPLIVVTNHVNFLEVPLLYTHLEPRRIVGFAKAEAWDNPILRFLADLWKPIPLRRGEADRTALRQALGALEAGRIFVLAPEGTRSGHGRLQRGNPGVVLLALQSGAPVLPLVHYGGELVWRNLARLRRTDFRLVAGRPFYLEAGATKVTSQVRRQMIDEIMYQMAALLPPADRGVYADLDGATETYLRFPAGSQSNLLRV